MIPGALLPQRRGFERVCRAEEVTEEVPSRPLFSRLAGESTSSLPQFSEVETPPEEESNSGLGRAEEKIRLAGSLIFLNLRK